MLCPQLLMTAHPPVIPLLPDTECDCSNPPVRWKSPLLSYKHHISLTRGLSPVPHRHLLALTVNYIPSPLEKRATGQEVATFFFIWSLPLRQAGMAALAAQAFHLTSKNKKINNPQCHRPPPLFSQRVACLVQTCSHQPTRVWRVRSCFYWIIKNILKANAEKALNDANPITHIFLIGGENGVVVGGWVASSAPSLCPGVTESRGWVINQHPSTRFFLYADFSWPATKHLLVISSDRYRSFRWAIVLWEQAATSVGGGNLVGVCIVCTASFLLWAFVNFSMHWDDLPRAQWL